MHYVELTSFIDGTETQATVYYLNDFLPNNHMEFYEYLADDLIHQCGGDLIKYSKFMDNMKIENITLITM